MATPIDRGEVLYQLERLALEAQLTDECEEETIRRCIKAIEQLVPTLTPPNETPPCYQPDGDGCAYQCYDGQDEPIDKCKECPLCYSDKQRQHTPPNEPLTLEQLREMDGPVWVACKPIEGGNGYWCLCKRGNIVTPAGSVFDMKEIPHWVFYRRPPEGQENL